MTECKIVEDLIPLYAEELTSEETTRFVEAHLEHCGQCRILLQRCRDTIPPGEYDGKEYKMAMRKNFMNMACRITVAILLLFVLLLFGSVKLGEYWSWKNGKAPVEQVVKAPVGNGQVTLVDWDSTGWKIGGAENAGTILWMRTMHVRDASTEDNVITAYSIRETGDTEPWENVQIHWAPNGIPFVATAELLEGGQGIFIHTSESWYDEEGGHHSESRFLPDTQGNGLVDVLTGLCAEHPDFPGGWETVEFVFLQWQDDSETITFVYETDTGCRGLLDYHYPTDTITRVD